MKKRLVVNSSVLIALTKLKLVDLLKDYDIVIPENVLEEIMVRKEEVEKIAEFFRVKSPKNKELNERLGEKLGKGESEVIALSLEEKSVAVLDDYVARKTARELGLKVKGTLGILIDAKKEGKIKELKSLLDELIKKDFRISKKLYEKALKLAGELS